MIKECYAARELLPEIERLGAKVPEGHNTLIAPALAIDQSEWMRLTVLYSYPMTATLFDQICVQGDEAKLSWNAHYQFYGDHIVVALSRYEWRKAAWTAGELETWIPDGVHSQAGYRMRFYHIGCQHNRWKGQQMSMHITRYVCPDCNYTTEIDSSD